jgi:hypothetical protein
MSHRVEAGKLREFCISAAPKWLLLRRCAKSADLGLDISIFRFLALWAEHRKDWID